MADPLPHDALTDEQTDADALDLYVSIQDVTLKADEIASIKAVVWAFEDACEEMDIDPIDTLCQLLDIERPVLVDDEDYSPIVEPAQPRPRPAFLRNH